MHTHARAGFIKGLTSGSADPTEFEPEYDPNLIEAW
jgi:hypothetical protein